MLSASGVVANIREDIAIRHDVMEWKVYWIVWELIVWDFVRGSGRVAGVHVWSTRIRRMQSPLVSLR